MQGFVGCVADQAIVICRVVLSISLLSERGKGLAQLLHARGTRRKCRITSSSVETICAEDLHRFLE